MLQDGQLVMHETAGVCRVSGQTHLDGLPGSYYVLCPLYLNDSTFYTPTDSQKVKLRPVMTAQQARALIRQLPQVQPTVFESATDQKQRCGAILKSGDSYQLAALTKFLYQDQMRRASRGKQAGVNDTTLLKKAQMLLFGELATALGVPLEEIPDVISGQLADSGEPNSAVG